MRAVQALQGAHRFYNEEQPRDENGRWTDGGSSGTYPNNSRLGALAGKPLPDHLRALGPKGYNESELKNMMGKSDVAGRELQEFTDAIKKQFGVEKDSGLSFKSEESAVGKALNEMGGNVAGIKDLVRNTIVPDDLETADAIARAITDKVQNDGGRVKYQDPDKFLGYRGYLVNVKTQSGLMVEMQINTPEMMYAKDGHLPYVKDLIGEERFNRIREKTGMEPGQGHEYYNQYRSIEDKSSPEAQAIKQKSQEYYRNFYKKL